MGMTCHPTPNEFTTSNGVGLELVGPAKLTGHGASLTISSWPFVLNSWLQPFHAQHAATSSWYILVSMISLRLIYIYIYTVLYIYIYIIYIYILYLYIISYIHILFIYIYHYFSLFAYASLRCKRCRYSLRAIPQLGGQPIRDRLQVPNTKLLELLKQVRLLGNSWHGRSSKRERFWYQDSWKSGLDKII